MIFATWRTWWLEWYRALSPNLVSSTSSLSSSRLSLKQLQMPRKRKWKTRTRTTKTPRYQSMVRKRTRKRMRRMSSPKSPMRRTGTRRKNNYPMSTLLSASE